MSTSYRQILEVLDSASRELPDADAPVMRTQISEWVEERPFVEIQAGDNACREFAATLKWPPVENQVLAQIHLRIACARDLVCELVEMKEPPLSTLLEDMIRMLLVDYWHGKGVDWARWKYDS